MGACATTARVGVGGGDGSVGDAGAGVAEGVAAVSRTGVADGVVATPGAARLVGVATTTCPWAVADAAARAAADAGEGAVVAAEAGGCCVPAPAGACGVWRVAVACTLCPDSVADGFLVAVAVDEVDGTPASPTLRFSSVIIPA